MRALHLLYLDSGQFSFVSVCSGLDKQPPLLMPLLCFVGLNEGAFTSGARLFASHEPTTPVCSSSGCSSSISFPLAFSLFVFLFSQRWPNNHQVCLMTPVFGCCRTRVRRQGGTALSKFSDVARLVAAEWVSIYAIRTYIFNMLRQLSFQRGDISWTGYLWTEYGNYKDVNRLPTAIRPYEKERIPT